MSAMVVIFPVVPVLRFADDFRSQRRREEAWQAASKLSPPPRTRPLLIGDRYLRQIDAVAAVMERG